MVMRVASTSSTLLLVIPAKAGIQFFALIEKELDPSLRWDDEQKTSYGRASPTCFDFFLAPAATDFPARFAS